MSQKGFVLLPIVLIILLIAGVGLGVYLVGQTQVFTPKAYYPQTSQSPVVIGMTHTHTSFAACNHTSGGNVNGFDNTGILVTYHQLGVRDQVKAELTRMRASGIQSLDVLIWHMHDFSDFQRWGVMPSATGRVEEPYRTNLMNYLQDVKEANFERVMITMGPQWRNSPGNYEGPGKYDPALFEENWQFLKDIRSIVKEHGPADSYFDILGEGAPQGQDPITSRVQNFTEYDKKLWTNYVQEFGKDDAVISFIAPASVVGAGTIDNLFRIYESTGKGQPNWYQFSFYPFPANREHSLELLDVIDKRLTANGLVNTPLIIREGWYNNPEVAQAIADFNNTHNRKITEALTWYLAIYDGVGNPVIDSKQCGVSPPYSMDQYISRIPQTNGQISASPNPCIIPANSQLCTTKVSWSTANTQNVVQIKVRGAGTLFAQAPSGSQDAPWVGETPVQLDLYDGKHFLNSIKLTGATQKAVISASPNPCVLNSNGICSSTITWSSENSPDLRITLKEAENKLFARSPSGTGEVNWIGESGYTFEAYSGDKLLTSLLVKGTPDPAIVPSPSAIPTSSTSPQKTGDIDQDGDVDIFDFNLFLRDYREQNLRSDFNKNKKVDIYDFNLLLVNFSK